MNNTSQNILNLESYFTSAFTQIWLAFISFIPSLLGALIVFAIGLALAGWLQKLTEQLIKATPIDNLTKNPAIKEFLKNGDIHGKAESIISEIIRWLVITVFFMVSCNILGLTPVTAFITSIFTYLPSLLASVIILVIGTLLAGFLEKIVKGSLGSIDISFARFMGKTVSYAVMVIAILAAISQAGIAQNLINYIFIGLIATTSLALGLGFGLGSKDLIKKFLEDWYSSLKK